MSANAALAADKPAALALPEVIAQVQPKIVKIYGAGGYRGLESYQSGMLISATGHVLTVWSYVLDTEFITVVLNDGRRFDAKLLAADPRLEAAVLKFDAQDLPHFDLTKAPQADAGARVLAFSNLFGIAVGNEPASVQHGVISARSRLDARRGGFKTPYRGPIYVTDTITNNPGAAGGALTNGRGELLGMLGKELRSAQTGAWLNYSIPAAEMAKTVDEIRAGRFVQRPADDQAAKPKQALSAELLGLVLVPDVLQRTPPYLDAVRANSPAARAGLRADDLVVFVNGRLVPSCKSLHNELEFVDRIDKVQITVMRGEDLIDVTLGADEAQP
ncbi:MAG: trypsin-like peptidase domain-containing protein [Planctomycetes bacterium]|nr:trypsin-like peptidase domain-containing protein [Planctomycetota bacterium]